MFKMIIWFFSRKLISDCGHVKMSCFKETLFSAFPFTTSHPMIDPLYLCENEGQRSFWQQQLQKDLDKYSVLFVKY